MAALILIAIIATVYLLITDKTEEKIKEIIKNFDYKKVVIIFVATIFLIVVPTLIYKNVIKYPYDSDTPKRQVGEVWWDDNDNKFEQKDGYVLKNCGCSDNEISQTIRSLGVTKGSAVAVCCTLADQLNK